MSVVHYLWIGPPTKTNPKSIAGHDVAGPIEMARQLKSQGATDEIRFWCLNEYKSAYDAQFSEAGVDINLCGIEDWLENMADICPETEVFTKLLPKTRGGIKDKVLFKDGFSLFILATQGGFFLDTNMFPTHSVSHPVDFKEMEKVTTARSPDGRHDFYFMYSPSPFHHTMQKVLENWVKRPRFSALSVFSEETIEEIPKLFWYELEERGIYKTSYKSYGLEHLKGLFYWIDSPKELMSCLSYGDVNQTCSYSSDIKLLDSCCLYAMTRLKMAEKMTEENFLRLPFDTDMAYVSTGSNVYFVNKKKGEMACVQETHDSRLDLFHHGHYGGSPIIPITSNMLPTMEEWIRHPRSKLPYIANEHHCTLLHHAVFSENMDLIKALVAMGARQDIKATYKIYDPEKTPAETFIKVTPAELATFLKKDKILAILEREADLGPAAMRLG